MYIETKVNIKLDLEISMKIIRGLYTKQLSFRPQQLQMCLVQDNSILYPTITLKLNIIADIR
jgi:hypothetical protein